MIKLKSLFRRGQGPSGSKQSGQLTSASSDDRLTKSSSVSSVDNIGVKQKKLTTKNQIFQTGSRDKLDQQQQNNFQRDKRPFRSGGDKLNRESAKNAAAAAQAAASLNKQIVEQSQQYSISSNNIANIQNDIGGGGITGSSAPQSIAFSQTNTNPGLSCELTNINFAGPKEVSFYFFFFFRQFIFISKKLHYNFHSFIYFIDIEFICCID